MLRGHRQHAGSVIRTSSFWRDRTLGSDTFLAMDRTNWQNSDSLMRRVLRTGHSRHKLWSGQRNRTGSLTRDIHIIFLALVYSVES